jgi:hypothetical protein
MPVCFIGCSFVCLFVCFFNNITHTHALLPWVFGEAISPCAFCVVGDGQYSGAVAWCVQKMSTFSTLTPHTHTERHTQCTDTRALSVVIACCFSLSLSLSLSLIALLFHRRGQSSFQPITRTGSILLGFDSSTISKVELVLERGHAGHTHTHMRQRKCDSICCKRCCT